MTTKQRELLLVDRELLGGGPNSGFCDIERALLLVRLPKLLIQSVPDILYANEYTIRLLDAYFQSTKWPSVIKALVNIDILDDEISLSLRIARELYGDQCVRGLVHDIDKNIIDSHYPDVRLCNPSNIITNIDNLFANEFLRKFAPILSSCSTKDHNRIIKLARYYHYGITLQMVDQNNTIVLNIIDKLIESINSIISLEIGGMVSGMLTLAIDEIRFRLGINYSSSAYSLAAETAVMKSVGHGIFRGLFMEIFLSKDYIYSAKDIEAISHIENVPRANTIIRNVTLGSREWWVTLIPMLAELDIDVDLIVDLLSKLTEKAVNKNAYWSFIRQLRVIFGLLADIPTNVAELLISSIATENGIFQFGCNNAIGTLLELALNSKTPVSTMRKLLNTDSNIPWIAMLNELIYQANYRDKLDTDDLDFDIGFDKSRTIKLLHKITG